MVRCAAALHEILEGEGGQHDDAGLPRHCRRDAANPRCPGRKNPVCLEFGTDGGRIVTKADLALALALRYQKLLD